MLKWLFHEKFLRDITYKILDERDCSLPFPYLGQEKETITKYLYLFANVCNCFYKTFHFVVVKCFALITASWNMTFYPIDGNHSDFWKWQFCAKCIIKLFRRNIFSVSDWTFKIVCLCDSCSICEILYVRERNCLKNHWADY